MINSLLSSSQHGTPDLGLIDEIITGTLTELTSQVSSLTSIQRCIVKLIGIVLIYTKNLVLTFTICDAHARKSRVGAIFEESSFHLRTRRFNTVKIFHLYFYVNKNSQELIVANY